MQKLIILIIASIFLSGCKAPVQAALPTPSYVEEVENPPFPTLQIEEPAPEPEEEPIIEEEPKPEEAPIIEEEPKAEEAPIIEEEPEPIIEEEPLPPASEIAAKMVVVTPEGSTYPVQKYGSPYDGDKLSNKRHDWYFNRNKEHYPPTAMWDFDIRLFDGYYLGDVSRKVVYLTFDEGYEFGCSPQILDTLLEKGVKATFFITGGFLKSEPELVKRMAAEGHIVANHTDKHKMGPEISEEEFIQDLTKLADNYFEVTDQHISPYYRPPAGVYSARTLALAKELGYKTVFWSSAHRDWETDNQPGKEAAYNIIMQDLHPGAIYLLHAVSWSNTEALPDIIDSMRESGYEFATLDDLPEYQLEYINP